MARYRIEITTSQSQIVDIEAESGEKALEYIKKKQQEGYFPFPKSSEKTDYKLLNDHCRQCYWAQAWECGAKVFYYCGKRKSNRTDNGLKKIKLKDLACLLFEKKEVKNG